MPENEEVSQTFIYIMLLGTLMSGAITNITMKMQDDFTENPATKQSWNHPFIQVFNMFVAETICLISFYILYHTNSNFKKNYELQLIEAHKQGLKTKVNPLIPYIPACCDIAGSTLQFLSLTMINQSIYVMLRGGVPAVTAIFSVVFLGRKLFSHHYLGLVLAIIGITIVGISQYYETNGSSYTIIGIICVIGSLLLTSIQFIVEEKILTTFYIPPLKLVGIEGLWGLFLSFAALLVAANIPCTYKYPVDGMVDPACNPNGRVEDPIKGADVIFNNWEMILYVLLNIISLTFFNFCGVSVTKYVSSLARSILTITVTVIVWIFDMIVLKENFYSLQLVGYIVLITGNLIYQEILEVPGMNKNTKKNMARLLSETQQQQKDNFSVMPSIDSEYYEPPNNQIQQGIFFKKLGI